MVENPEGETVRVVILCPSSTEGVLSTIHTVASAAPGDFTCPQGSSLGPFLSGLSAKGETNYKQTGGSQGHSKAGGHLHPDPPGYDVAEGEPEVWAANRMLLLLGCTSKEALRLSRRASSSPQGLEIRFWKEGCWQSVADLVHQ